MNCKEHILLTGAGFTKNFGAPLASELWSIIYNSPELNKAPGVRDRLRQDFDFESAYHQIMHGGRLLGVDRPDWTTQRKALEEAVVNAFSFMDDKICKYSHNTGSPYALNKYAVDKLLGMLAGSKGNPGYFFTLNQDLFIERHYHGDPVPSLLGLQCDWVSNKKVPLGVSDYIIPSSIAQISIDKDTFHYVKLHGSSNWYTDDQRRTMVIGHGKKNQIGAHWLLSEYFKRFQQVLAGGSKRLLCVGYGFSDQHINEAISDGINKANLRLYVLSPESPRSLSERLHETGPIGASIWKGLAGYFQVDLKTLFPVDQSETAEWNMLRATFFG